MSAPYYTDGQVTLYHGDCLEVTEWLAADVLVTDPPYGMRFQSGFGKWAVISGDDTTDARDAMLALWGHGRHGRPALLFGTWRVPPPHGERQRLIWWKRSLGPGMGDLRMPWGTSHEDIYILGAGWALGEQLRHGSVYATDAVQGGTSGVVARAGHPTAKPVGLLEQLIASCPPGVIADPFAGGGSTLLAGRNLGRRVIGVEIDEAYCEVIATRLSAGVFDFGDVA